MGLLKEFGGNLVLRENWARKVLKSMDWIKRKGTTGKVKPSKKFLEKEKFTFQRNISYAILYNDVPSVLALNLDQTPPFLSLSGELYLFIKGVKKCSH